MPKKVHNPNLVSPGTMILTRDGEKEIQSITGRVVEVWNGMAYTEAVVTKVTEFGIQDQKNVLAIDFDNGRRLCVSRSFQFNPARVDSLSYKAKDLSVGLVVAGWKLPDATRDIAAVSAITKMGEASVMYYIMEPDFGRVVMNGIMVPDERGR